MENYENILDSTEFANIVGEKGEVPDEGEQDALESGADLGVAKDDVVTDGPLELKVVEDEDGTGGGKVEEDEDGTGGGKVEEDEDGTGGDKVEEDEDGTSCGKVETDIQQVLVDADGDMSTEEEEIIPSTKRIVVVIPEATPGLMEDAKIEEIDPEELLRNVHIVNAIDVPENIVEEEEANPMPKVKGARKQGQRKSVEKNGPHPEKSSSEGSKAKSKKSLSASPNTSEKSAKKDFIADGDLCRICLCSESLVSIFYTLHDPDIADKIMLICTGVKIVEKDFLPQFICQTCLDSLNIALKFKALCEKTDKELRSHLTRSKNKVRRPRGYVLIDAVEGGSESDDGAKNNDDEEFQLSHVSEASGAESDSDSDFSINKRRPGKRRPRKRTKSGGTKKNRSTTRQSATPGAPKREKRSKPVENVSPSENVFIKTEQTTDEEGEPPKKRRSKAAPKTDEEGDVSTPESKKKEFSCVYCKEVLPTMSQLREHKKTHAGEKPFTCHVCSKQFKLLGSFDTHLKRHMNEEVILCDKCEKRFPNKTELRRHLIEVHGEPAATFVCDKCKKAFTTQPRLDRHKESKCPGYEISAAKKPKPEPDATAIGKDLFKCVAPMTTTYWSDSFSD